MKTFYTSYFARNAQHPNAIAICCVLTSWVRENAGFRGEHWPELGPTWEMVQRAKNGEEIDFKHEYLTLLENKRKFTPEYVVNILPDQAILLCYERPFDYCHRHVLSEWLSSSNLCTIKELLTHDEQRYTKQQQIIEQTLEW